MLKRDEKNVDAILRVRTIEDNSLSRITDYAWNQGYLIQPLT